MHPQAAKIPRMMFSRPPPKLPFVRREALPVPPEREQQDAIIVEDSTEFFEHPMSFSPVPSPSLPGCSNNDTDVDSGMISDGEVNSSPSHAPNPMSILSYSTGDIKLESEISDEYMHVDEVDRYDTKDVQLDSSKVKTDTDEQIEESVIRSAYIEHLLSGWNSDRVLEWKKPSDVRLGRSDRQKSIGTQFNFFSAKDLIAHVTGHIPSAIMDGTPAEIWDPTTFVKSVDIDSSKSASSSSIPTEFEFADDHQKFDVSTTYVKRSCDDKATTSGVHSSNHMGATVEVDRISPLSMDQFSISKEESSDSENDVVIIKDSISQKGNTSFNNVSVTAEERQSIALLTAYCGCESVNLSETNWFEKLMDVAQQTTTGLQALIHQQRIRRAAARGRNEFLKRKVKDERANLCRLRIVWKKQKILLEEERIGRLKRMGVYRTLPMAKPTYRLVSAPPSPKDVLRSMRSRYWTPGQAPLPAPPRSGVGISSVRPAPSSVLPRKPYAIKRPEPSQAVEPPEVIQIDDDDDEMSTPSSSARSESPAVLPQQPQQPLLVKPSETVRYQTRIVDGKKRYVVIRSRKSGSLDGSPNPSVSSSPVFSTTYDPYVVNA